MVIDLIVVGKTDTEAIEKLLTEYMKRINFYVKFSLITVPDKKNGKKVSLETIKKDEGKLILNQLNDNDYLVLLDEKGQEYKSIEFSVWIQKCINKNLKRLIFLIGGPYGFSDSVYERADAKISLSKMTFSHQLIRVIFAEQLYRAFTILNHEPYHHE